MLRPWRVGLLLLAIAAVLAANHWRYWWGPAYQQHMLLTPCPDDPGVDPFTVKGDAAGLCAYRADNQRRIAAGERPELVLFGDSILGDWQMVQPGLFGANWVNRGIGGQDSTQLLARFRQDVIALRPRVVLIEAGTNDMIARRGVIGPDDFRANLESLVDLAEVNGIVPVLATVPPIARFPTRPRLDPAPLQTAINRHIRDLASKRGLVLADFHAALAAADGHSPRPELSLDGVHPTAEGYRMLEPVVRRALEQAQAQAQARQAPR